MPMTEAQKRADARYRKKAYEQITCKSRRADRLNDLIDAAATKRGISKASYILAATRTIDALCAALNCLPSDIFEYIPASSAEALPPAPGEDTPARLPARTATDGAAQEHDSPRE